MKTIVIASLTNLGKQTIAGALGLTVRQMLIDYGSTQLGSFIDTLISNANTITEMIDYLYNNTTRLSGVASANSSIETYMDACTAIDHYNDHHSDQRNLPNPPNKPPDPQLPIFICPGVCGNTYTTVGEALSDHYAKCRTGVDTFDFPDEELKTRSVEDGCGRDWYTCETEKNDVNTPLHLERDCNLTVYVYDSFFDRVQTSNCSKSYRRCLKKTYDHNPRVLGKSAHSDEVKQIVSPTPTPVPIPINTVDGACGVHTGIDASEANNHEWGTAPCGDATHVGYLCQIIASDHEWVYESCPSSHAHYACDGSDHSLQASCPETNANGDTCTVTNFYACETHTHQY